MLNLCYFVFFGLGAFYFYAVYVDYLENLKVNNND